MMVKDGVGMVWASIRGEEERVLMPSRMLGDYVGPGDSAYTTYDEAVTKRTVEWLGERKDAAPWCLYVGLVAPHFPLVAPQEFYDMYPAKDLPPVKLHPNDGHPRHPWVQKQFEIDQTEDKFETPEERLAAMSAYYGLTTFLDHNVGRILRELKAGGLSDDTTVIYTSDHGDNVGARGLWGKSNMYEESAAIPLIMAGPEIKHGVCETPVSLIDLSTTIADHFGETLGDTPGRSLYDIAAEPEDTDREVFSEYHAAGAVTGSFMLRKGQWKLIYYVGFEPELFDLAADPEELTNRAADPSCTAIVTHLTDRLYAICDPELTDTTAHADQAAMIASYGGREAALKLGAPAATPPPEVSQ